MNDTIAVQSSLLCVLAGAIGASCSSSSTSHFDTVGSTNNSSVDAGTASDDGGASAPSSGSVSSSGGAVFANDDDAAASASDCKPGTYSGPFTTKVFVGDGGPGPFALMWTGTLTVTLVAQMETVTAGELPTSTLTIAPGGRLQGMDNFKREVRGGRDRTARLFVQEAAGRYLERRLRGAQQRREHHRVRRYRQRRVQGERAACVERVDLHRDHEPWGLGRPGSNGYRHRRAAIECPSSFRALLGAWRTHLARVVTPWPHRVHRRGRRTPATELVRSR
jgi:hypothetical protein